MLGFLSGYQRVQIVQSLGVIQGPSAVNIIIWGAKSCFGDGGTHCSLPELHNFSLLHGIVHLDRPGAETL